MLNIPIQLRDLYQRVSNSIDQINSQTARKLNFNSFTYDPSMRTLSNDNLYLRFTEKESQIFNSLLDNSNIYGDDFNIGSGKPFKIKEITKIINKYIGKGKPLYGKIKMRKDDHQIHFDMQALLLTEKKDQSVIYRNQDFDMSYVTVGNIPMDDITLDTSCEMKRP